MCAHMCICTLYSIVCDYSLPPDLVGEHVSYLNILHIHLALIPTQNFKLAEGMAILVLFFAISPVPGTEYVFKNTCGRRSRES